MQIWFWRRGNWSAIEPLRGHQFFASLYLADINPQQAILILEKLDFALPVSEFHLLELQNALSLAELQKRISKNQALKAWLDIEDDLSKGRLLHFWLVGGALFFDSLLRADEAGEVNAQSPAIQ